jgi:hypothetical protein
MTNTNIQIRKEDFPDTTNNSRRGLIKAAGALLASTALGVRLPLALADAGSLTARSEPSRWGNPTTLVSAIAAGTLCVPSVTETVSAYRQGFGYQELWRGRVPQDIAQFWGSPAMAGRNSAVVGPPGYRSGLLRIVELGDDYQRLDFHQSLGWVALEIRVRSPDDVLSQLKGLPFEHMGGPGDSSTVGGTPSYRAAQFKGPAGEPLYFTQHTQLDTLVQLGTNNVGPLFIQTLAARPYTETRDFYQKTLGMDSRMEVDVSRDKLTKELELPRRDYKMAALRAPEYCSIQIDEYPEAAGPRPHVEGCLVPGAAICSFTTNNLDPVADALRQAGLTFSTMESYPIPPAHGGRAILCKGYSGEIIEFLEC